MALNHREDRELIRDTLEWFNKDGQLYQEYSNRWKRELAEEIRTLIRYYENKEVKLESVIRNLNRMISYYYETGAQARSGKRYLKYLEIILKERFERAFTVAHALGGGVAQRFLTLEDARIYAEQVPQILKIYFDPETKLWYVFRYPSEPLG